MGQCGLQCVTTTGHYKMLLLSVENLITKASTVIIISCINVSNYYILFFISYILMTQNTKVVDISNTLNSTSRNTENVAICLLYTRNVNWPNTSLDMSLKWTLYPFQVNCICQDSTIHNLMVIYVPQ